MGEWMMGPRPAWMSKGMFMPVRGVRMSEKRITPSGLKACHGCSDTSTCAEGFPSYQVPRSNIPSGP